MASTSDGHPLTINDLSQTITQLDEFKKKERGDNDCDSEDEDKGARAEAAQRPLVIEPTGEQQGLQALAPRRHAEP